MTAERSKAAKHRFEIDRAKWARGKRGEKPNMLLDSEDGSMCCLGFFLRSCGVPENELKDVGEPNEVASERALDRQEGTWPDAAAFLVRWDIDEAARAAKDEGAYWADDDTCARSEPDEGELMGTNDDAELDEPSRENRIKTIFADHGVEVVFVGEGKP